MSILWLQSDLTDAAVRGALHSAWPNSLRRELDVTGSPSQGDTLQSTCLARSGDMTKRLEDPRTPGASSCSGAATTRERQAIEGSSVSLETSTRNRGFAIMNSATRDWLFR